MAVILNSVGNPQRPTTPRPPLSRQHGFDATPRSSFILVPIEVEGPDLRRAPAAHLRPMRESPMPLLVGQLGLSSELVNPRFPDPFVSNSFPQVAAPFPSATLSIRGASIIHPSLREDASAISAVPS